MNMTDEGGECAEELQEQGARGQMRQARVSDGQLLGTLKRPERKQQTQRKGTI